MNDLLPIHLQTAVPLRIAELEAQGGPTSEDFARIQSYSEDLGANGDAILFYVKGKTSEMVTKLVDEIAVMSFVPGGITTFGLNFKGEPDGG